MPASVVNDMVCARARVASRGVQGRVVVRPGWFGRCERAADAAAEWAAIAHAADAAMAMAAARLAALRPARCSRGAGRGRTHRQDDRGHCRQSQRRDCSGRRTRVAGPNPHGRDRRIVVAGTGGCDRRRGERSTPTPSKRCSTRQNDRRSVHCVWRAPPRRRNGKTWPRSRRASTPADVCVGGATRKVPRSYKRSGPSETWR